MLIPLLLLLACGSNGPPPDADQALANISVTFCDKAGNTHLVRVGLGGENNIGETEAVPIACEDNDKALGCTFTGVKPGSYRIEDGVWSALVYAGPTPSPTGDAHVEMACQGTCVDNVTVTSEGCGDSGVMHVYTADPAPIATLINDYPWEVGKPVKVGPSTCGRLVAEVETPNCGTLVESIQPTGMINKLGMTLSPPVLVDLAVTDDAGKPIANAYVSDDASRTQHTDASGKLTLRRPKDAPHSIWVQAPGFAGRLFPVPELPATDGAAPPTPVTLSMTAAMTPTHPVAVTCTQAGKPCAGPLVEVGIGMDARACEAKNGHEWTCEAAKDESVWARQGTNLSPRVAASGSVAAVALP